MKVINYLGNKYQGTLGKAVTASNWKGINYFKKHFKPANPKSAKQVEVRNWFTVGVTKWHTFSAIQKAAYGWAIRYHKLVMSPFNDMVGVLVKTLKAGDTYTDPPAGPWDIDDGADPIQGAYVVVKKAGQSTIFAYGYTDALGELPWSLPSEDENYDLYITADGFDDYKVLNTTAALVVTTHHLNAE